MENREGRRPAGDPFPLRREEGEGRVRVVLELRRHGRDLVLTVGGGRTHVGAVAVHSPSGGTRGEPLRSLAVVPGHREGPLAAEAAERLSDAARATVVAVVGIHQDEATREEIAAIVANVRRGVAALAGALPPPGT